jgi:plastocyanin
VTGLTRVSKNRMAIFRCSCRISCIDLAAWLAAFWVGAGWSLSPGASLWASNAWAEGSTERVFELRIETGKVAPDKRTLRVTQGDTVRLRWTAGARTVVHLHGYDIEKEVAPGRVTEFHFKAHAAGRFVVNVHPHDGGTSHHGPPLVVLEVHPR